MRCVRWGLVSLKQPDPRGVVYRVPLRKSGRLWEDRR